MSPPAAPGAERAAPRSRGRADPAPPLDPLSRLAIRHGADKWGFHLYTPIYNRFFEPLRERPLRVLELGVGGYGRERQGGASLRMWADYFGAAQIVGIDVFPKTLDLPPRVTVLQGDQTDAAFLAGVWATHGPFDIVIDDASHRAAETCITFDILFPRLATGALYVVEDLQCAFWPAWGGRREGGGFVARLQALIGDIHDREIAAFHPDHRPSAYGAMVAGMHLFHNLAVIERGVNTFPSLFAFDDRHPQVLAQLEALRAIPAGERTDGSFLTEASLHAAGRDLRQAMAVTREGLKTHPRSAVLLDAAQQWSGDLRQHTRREAYLRRLLDVAPQDRAAACLLAACLADQGRTADFGRAAEALDAAPCLVALRNLEAGGPALSPSLSALRSLLQLRVGSGAPPAYPPSPGSGDDEALPGAPPMSDDATPRLALPYLAAAQAQKHVTLNEALSALDGLVQCAAESRSVAAEPASPDDGVVFILPAGAVGPSWAGQPAGSLLRFEAGAWIALSAQPGALAFVMDERRLVVRQPEGWAPLEGFLTALDGLAHLGVGAAADSVNRLSVSSPSALFSHAGGDMRVAVNKASPASTASIVLEDGFSARAEIGLAGDDNLHVKVSPDGATWRDAMVVAAADGAVTLPGNALTVRTPANGIGVDEPGGAWAAKLINQTNSEMQNGVLVANMWYSSSTWTLLVGSSNHLIGGPGFKAAFGVRGDGHSVFSAPVQLASSPAGQLPSAAACGAGTVMFVPDESGGATLAFSDGSVWRRVQDRAPVS